jgi:hypothetical protein
MSKSIYLVAAYYMKPRNRVQTQIKGWMGVQDNVAYDEKVDITRNLKKSDLSTAKVILDLKKKTVVRNGWNNDLDFDKIFEYFHNGYPQYTTTVMTELDPEYLTRFEKPAASNSALSIDVLDTEVVEIDTSTEAKVL